MSQITKQVKLSNAQKIFQLIEWIALVLLVLLPAYYYSSLPDLVPRHFGINGLPDAYAGKMMIWFSPITGLMTYLMCVVANYTVMGHLKNKSDSQEINEKMHTTINMMNKIKLFLLFIFVYLTYSTIQVALGNAAGLGSWFVYIILIGLIGIIAYFFVKKKKKK